MKKTVALFVLVYSSFLCAEQRGVIVPIDPTVAQEISSQIPTKNAVQIMLSAQNNNIFWLNRHDSSTYHISLDLFENDPKIPCNPKFLPASNQYSLDYELKKIIENSKKFNKKQTNSFKYKAKGTGLILFAHYNTTPKRDISLECKDADNLVGQGDLAYANLVLLVDAKRSNNVSLAEDWSDTRDVLNQRGTHPNLTFNKAGLPLITHITIADFFKYDGSKYTIEQQGNFKKVVAKNNTAKVFNTPFIDPSETATIAKAFKAICQQFQQTKQFELDKISITEKNSATGQLTQKDSVPL